MNASDVIREASKTAVNVTQHAIKTGIIFATEEKVAERMSICLSCTDFITESKKCSRCGCVMERKTSLEAARCPISKW